MFSGIVETQAMILTCHDWHFVMQNPFVGESESLHIGQSIAHDGACMSIDSIEWDTYSFFAMQESLDKTNFGRKKIWSSFNVERCMRLQDRIDWHIVTWHIDTPGTVSEYRFAADGSLFVQVDYPEQFGHLIIAKWSIAINGVSLTVVDDKPGSFSVWLIPLTQTITNLWNLNLGDSVNLEFDMFAKYAYKRAR
jgi:riboflavin synthase